MGIKLGNLDISKIMLGNVEANKIYFGSTEVYSSGPDYLCFEAVENTNIAFVINGTLSTVPTIQYRISNGTWTNYTFGNTISLTIGQKCFWKGDNNSFSQDDIYIKFTSTGKVKASGNIMSLLDSTCQSVTIPTNKCFNNLFSGCSNLLSTPALPATNLADFCYYGMFSGCTSLTTAPALPATTLAGDCYSSMFSGCTSLTTAPALPATTLASYCYYQMFCDCTSLTTAPALPATTLASNCYRNIFYGCTSLQVSDAQTTEAPYAWHIPTNGTFTNTTTRNQNKMFTNCLGTRSSNDVSGALGESHTYYTQNAPIQ